MPSNDISQKVIEHLEMKLIKITSLILFTAFGVLAQASPAGREWRLTYLIGVDLGTKSSSLRIDADGKPSKPSAPFKIHLEDFFAMK